MQLPKHLLPAPPIQAVLNRCRLGRKLQCSPRPLPPLSCHENLHPGVLPYRAHELLALRVGSHLKCAVPEPLQCGVRPRTNRHNGWSNYPRVQKKMSVKDLPRKKRTNKFSGRVVSPGRQAHQDRNRRAAVRVWPRRNSSACFAQQGVAHSSAWPSHGMSDAYPSIDSLIISFQTPAALERMEEMRQLIGQRQGEGTPRTRPLSMAVDTPLRTSGSNRTEDIHRSLTTLVTEADASLVRAASNHEALENGIQQLAEDLQEVRIVSLVLRKVINTGYFRDHRSSKRRV